MGMAGIRIQIRLSRHRVGTHSTRAVAAGTTTGTLPAATSVRLWLLHGREPVDRLLDLGLCREEHDEHNRQQPVHTAQHTEHPKF